MRELIEHFNLLQTRLASHGVLTNFSYERRNKKQTQCQLA